MSKLGKKTKISIIIVIILPILSALLIGGKIVMDHPKSKQEQAEEYILREAKIGLKIWFKKYYDGVDSNSIKLKIKQHEGMTTGPYIEGYVNDDKDLWFTCSVIKLSKNEWETVQDELGMVMVISDNGESGELNEMLKYEYSYANPNHKSPKRPSELIPESEVKKVRKDRYLLDYIPEMKCIGQ